MGPCKEGYTLEPQMKCCGSKKCCKPCKLSTNNYRIIYTMTFWIPIYLPSMGLVNIQYLKACVAYLKLGGIVEYDLCITNRENLRGRPNKQRG